MSRVIIIPVEGEPFEADMDLSFPAAKLLVGNAWIEQVRVNPMVASYLEVHSDTVRMLVDEESLLKNLPVNWNASPLYTPDVARGLIRGQAALVGMVWDDESMGFDWADCPAIVTPESVVKSGDMAYRVEVGFVKPEPTRG